VSRALRERHEEILVHTDSTTTRRCRNVFFRDLGIPRPTCQLGVGSGAAGPRMATMVRGLRGRDRGAPARRGDGLRRHRLDAGRRSRRARGGAAHRARRGGLRSFNLRMPERSTAFAADHLSDCSVPDADGGARALERARARTRRGRRRRDARTRASRSRMRRGVSACRAFRRESRASTTPRRCTARRTPTIPRVSPRSWRPWIRSIGRCCSRAIPGPRRLSKWQPSRTHFPRSGSCRRFRTPTDGLLAESRALLTDSGGLQKEAYFSLFPA